MIGVLYICTGRYTLFWKDFYTSAEKYFFPGLPKRYFVFTDTDRIFADESHNVTKIYQETLAWPLNTLLRFETFLKAEPELNTCEYLFFLNANIVFVDEVNTNVLPDDTNEGLLVVTHPGFWNKSNLNFPYDHNPASSAYIPEGIGEHYFMGGFNGGKTKDYLALIRTLAKNIREDLDQGIIALWHDESHLNHYMLNRRPKILTPSYGYVEGFDLPYKPIVKVLRKEHFGGHNYLRGISNTKSQVPYSNQLKRKLKAAWRLLKSVNKNGVSDFKKRN